MRSPPQRRVYAIKVGSAQHRSKGDGAVHETSNNLPTKTMQRTTTTPTSRCDQFFSRLASWLRTELVASRVEMAAIVSGGEEEWRGSVEEASKRKGQRVSCLSLMGLRIFLKKRDRRKEVWKGK